VSSSWSAPSEFPSRCPGCERTHIFIALAVCPEALGETTPGPRAPILNLSYFGQDERLKDEAAVVRAVGRATEWILDCGYKNILSEVNNECNIAYDHAILKPDRVHELIERVKARRRDSRRLLVGTSYGGGTVAGENAVRASDFLVMHGNGGRDLVRIAAMVRAVPGYRPMPILFNEDDHFDFDRPSKTTSNPPFRSGRRGVTSTRARRTTATDISRRP
jgi:hypothetical protein